MRFAVLVETRLHDGVADPQGATIERSLPALGFDGVSGVKVGKCFRFGIEAADADAARSEVEDMCARFLTNPVIEGATISIDAGADGGGGAR
ncbi:MAG TPA: phosphoribosylformylglycinamidine synthase subunit PurS [Acidimicrobiales bacterium]